MASQEDRIHNALYEAITTGSYPLVSYDPQTGLRTSDEDATELPTTIKIRPQTSSFDVAEGYRRRPHVQDRVGWTWTAELRWNNQVSLELWERAWAEASILLPRTDELDQQVAITLTRVDYTHPPEHASSSGTCAEMTFSAILSRK